jgi:hypothetical protein
VTCPRCTRPIRGPGYLIHDAQWWHRVCARDAGILTEAPRRAMGRPRSSLRGAGSRQVVVRVSEAEGELLDVAERLSGQTPAEQMRRARFGRGEFRLRARANEVDDG